MNLARQASSTSYLDRVNVHQASLMNACNIKHVWKLKHLSSWLDECVRSSCRPAPLRV